MAVATPAVPATTIPQLNNTGQVVDVAFTGGTVTALYSTLPYVPPAFATPAVPATTVTASNTSGTAQLVTVAANGATITAITVNGVASGLIVGAVVVPAGGTVSISYTVATPTWTWAPVLAGFSGTSIPSPSSLPVMPGGSVVWVGTVAPTWAWTAPEDLGYTPWYAQENLVAINELTQLPFAQHAEGGEPGLGTGVSN